MCENVKFKKKEKMRMKKQQANERNLHLLRKVFIELLKSQITAMSREHIITVNWCPLRTQIVQMRTQCTHILDQTKNYLPDSNDPSFIKMNG